MAAGRIAAVVVALLSIQLSAQTAPQGNVTIQVTDIIGAVIPGARIEIDPSPSKPGSVQKTDSKGQAVFDLPVGVHTFAIRSLDFKQWTRQIDVRSGGQLVDAKLDLDDGMIIDWVTVSSNDADFPLLTPKPIFLPLQPMRNLAPLPNRPAKKRW